MISIIVAIAENYAIGKKGDLLCHLPNDLKHFKEITGGKTVMMGERTFFSLPKHPLPNRRNIVLTDVPGKTFDGAEAVYSIDEMIKASSRPSLEGRGTAPQDSFISPMPSFFTNLCNVHFDNIQFTRSPHSSLFILHSSFFILHLNSDFTKSTRLKGCRSSIPSPNPM